MKLNAVFHRKEYDFEESPCVVEKVIDLNAADFEYFRRHMLTDTDFISDNSDLMYQDRESIYHCLLVLGEGYDDGILIESEGSSYARYSAFVPGARQLVELQQAEKLTEEQEEQADVNELFLAEDSAETTAHIMNVPDCVGDGRQMMSLFGMLGCSFQDVHLCPCDEEHDLATIDELNQNTLTEQGKTDWADVLGATVHRVYEGSYGLQMELSGVEPQRLCDFSYMLAGHCAAKDYDRWVRQDSEPTKTISEQEPEQPGPALSM